ncbi:MAG: FHA domain-containing protein [Anaerolineales bacterium]|jgi:pSer/pThr/pTyr-binding forkhead associated (FHA) protein
MTGMILLLIRAILALTLYAFLGWAFITIWRDLRQQKTTVQNQQLPEINLHIQNGEEVVNQLFQGTEVTLGRDPTCECTLISETVSARHARFTYHHGQWWLEDLKSTNGTIINGQPLTTAIVVIPGDQIHCGDIQINILEE